MGSLFKLLIPLTSLVFVIGQVGCFTGTNKLLAALNGLEQKGSSSLMCYNQLATPMRRVDDFVKDTVGIHRGLSDLNGRCSTINTLASTILLIPGVNVIAAPVFGPFTAGVTHLTRVISIILTAADPFVNSIKSWEDPIKTVTQTKASSVPVLQRIKDAAENGKRHISETAVECTRLPCGGTRSSLVNSFENTARGKDTLPNTLTGDLSKADTACGEVREFFDSTSSKISPQVSTSLSMAKSGIDFANNAFAPIQQYLDEANRVLDQRLCLLDAERILKQAGVAIEGLFPSLGPKPDYEKPSKPDYHKPSKPSSGRWKRDVCLTVRQILDSSIAVDAGAVYAGEFLLKEIFNRAMPQLPELNNELTNLASTLTPFTNFDLRSKSSLMVLPQANVNSFLGVNYVSMFREKAPAGSLTGNTRTCSGETALSVPAK